MSIPNPYVGPKPLSSSDPIFGRDRELRELRYLLTSERIVLLYSPSGAGKSSLIHAKNGLCDQLRVRFDVWHPTRVQTPNPKARNRYVWSAANGFEHELPDRLRRSPESFAQMSLKDYVASRPRRPGAHPNIVLIFDQFEEILRVEPLNIEAKNEFFRQAGELLLDPMIWALFVLREDYLAPLDPYRRLVPTRLQHRYRLDLLGIDDAREAIAKPVLGGRTFTEPAVDKLIHDLAAVKVQQPDGSFIEQTGHYVEPLQLQVVCRGLWDRMPDSDLDVDPEDVEQFGNVTQALSAYYKDAVASVAGKDIALERAIRDWFDKKLITPDGIRGQVQRGARMSDGLSNEIIQGPRSVPDMPSLVDTHLVRAEQRGAVWFELAHDRLIDPVRTNNAAWRDDHLHKVQKVAALWDAQGLPEGLLLLGADLEEAKQWRADNPAQITALEQRFIEESCARQRAIEKEEQQARNLRIKSRIAYGFAVVAAIACVIAGWKTYESRLNEAEAKQQQTIAQKVGLAAIGAEFEAHEKAEIANDNGRLADAKTIEAEANAAAASTNAEKALNNLVMLYQEKARAHVSAGDINDSPEDYLHGWVYNLAALSRAKEPLPGAAGLLLRNEIRPGNQDPDLLASDLDRADHFAFYGGGAQYFYTKVLSREQTLTRYTIFSAADRNGLGELANATALSSRSDGQLIAWGTDEEGVVVRNLPQRVRKPLADRPAASALLFLDSGNCLAVGTKDGSIRLYQLDGVTAAPEGQYPCPVKTCGPVQSLAFAKDRMLLAAGFSDGTIRQFRFSKNTIQPIGGSDIQSGRNAVGALAYWPGSRMLVSGHADGTIRVWDSNSARELARVKSHDEAIIAITFNDKADTMATASRDGVILQTRLNPRIFARTWDLRSLLETPDVQQAFTGFSQVSSQELGYDTSKTEPTPTMNVAAAVIKYFSFGSIPFEDKLLLRSRNPPTVTLPQFIGADMLLIPNDLKGAAVSVVHNQDMRDGFVAEFQLRLWNAATNPYEVGDGAVFMFYKDRLAYATQDPPGGGAMGYIPGSGYGVRFNISPYLPPLTLLGPDAQAVRADITQRFSRSEDWQKVCIEVSPTDAGSACSPGPQPFQGVRMFLEGNWLSNGAVHSTPASVRWDSAPQQVRLPPT